MASGFVKVGLQFLLLAVLASGARAAMAEPHALDSEPFLFLDEMLLDSVEGAHLQVNPPKDVELVIIADQPWEAGGITSYGNVFYDTEAGEYRMYYVPVCWDVEPGFGYCLATSQDGEHWIKPNLGAVEWKGSTDNNFVLWAQREGTVFLDPNAPPESRYAIISSDPDQHTRFYTSPDGIHFTLHGGEISAIHSDSQISSFWDADKALYFHYPRVGYEGLRASGVITAKTVDEPWPADIPVVLSRDARDPAQMDLYTNACQKYFRARDTYVGFPTPYYHYNAEGRQYLNAPTLAIGGKGNDGTIETQLATSRDGIHWTRHRAPYLPVDQYDGIDVKVLHAYPGLLDRGDRIYQYFAGYAFTHGDTQIRYGDGGRRLGGIFLAKQRRDGFMSLDFDYEGGTVTTEPLTFTGDCLALNVNTSASGEARVALLDAAGGELPGFGLADARIINGSYTSKMAAWKDGSTDVSALAGQPVRLRFICRGTKLYSFQFRAAGPPAPYTADRTVGDPPPCLNERTAPAAAPVDAAIGPHLFIDGYLIASSEGLEKVTHSPSRALDTPILGWEANTTQPYVTVVRDRETERFRMWYNRGGGRGTAIGYAESADGIAWETPKPGVLGDTNKLMAISALFQNAYGVSVIDEGPAFPYPERRFKMAWWGQTRPWPDGDPGFRVAFSPDGLHWEPSAMNPVLPDYGEPWFMGDPRRPYGTGDIIDVYWDPIHKEYGSLLKTPAVPADGLETGPKARTYIRRLISQTASRDFEHWERPWRVAVPEERDEGLLEFYGAGGTIARGGLLIGFARMLRDDAPADPGGEPEGIGWSTLMTSRDGRHWERHDDIFFDRNHDPGTWDHAMTWIGSVVPVGDEYYIYYGGYARGHKSDPAKERQLGLARMPLDRFVSRRAKDDVEGRLVTVPFAGKAGKLLLNAKTGNGFIAVRVLDLEGKPMEGAGFTSGNPAPVIGDGPALAVAGIDLSSLDGKSFRLEFALKNAELFGFELE